MIPALTFAVETSPHLEQLQQYDLQPTADSLGAYLTSLHPSPQQRRQLVALTQQLGSPDFAVREAAARQLQQQAAGVSEILQEATRSDNAEIRWRAKQVLLATQSEGQSLLNAVFATIEHERLRGLCRPLLGAIPFCREDYLRVAARKALVATALPEDETLLRENLQAKDPHTRVAALATLGRVFPAHIENDALRLLLDDDEGVQVAAARELADRGRRESLAALVRLLESSEIAVRIEAVRVLRAVTGEQRHFTVYESAEKRAAAVADWQAWLAESGATAQLKFPLATTPLDLGRLLVCDHGQNKLIEFDSSGKEIWQKSVALQPWACAGLPNGHRLVGSYNERSVVEFDDAGREVWRIDSLPGGPMGIDRLDNGNTLVACADALQVIEVTPDKRTIWQVQLAGRPVEAHRLGDGRTLVALQNEQKVVEVDSTGKVVWEIPNIGMVFSAQRLENGTTLVACIGRPEICEYDRAGQVVWSRGAFSNPYYVQRLANDNTLVVDASGVTEIDRTGKSVRKIDMPNLSRACRY
jgi:HEAT repeat protein